MRINLIEEKVRNYEGIEDDDDVQDLIFEQIRLNPEHDNNDIARTVAMLILQA